MTLFQFYAILIVVVHGIGTQGGVSVPAYLPAGGKTNEQKVRIQCYNVDCKDERDALDNCLAPMEGNYQNGDPLPCQTEGITYEKCGMACMLNESCSECKATNDAFTDCYVRAHNTCANNEDSNVEVMVCEGKKCVNEIFAMVKCSQDNSCESADSYFFQPEVECKNFYVPLMECQTRAIDSKCKNKQGAEMDTCTIKVCETVYNAYQACTRKDVESYKKTATLTYEDADYEKLIKEAGGKQAAIQLIKNQCKCAVLDIYKGSVKVKIGAKSEKELESQLSKIEKQEITIGTSKLSEPKVTSAAAQLEIGIVMFTMMGIFILQ